MREKIFCEKCGSEMIPVDENKPIGMVCPNCGFGFVTSYIDPIFEDENVYAITLEAGNTCNNSNLKIISKITGENYIHAKKLITSAPVVITKGDALDILSVRKKLDENGIKYSVSPKFPY